MCLAGEFLIIYFPIATGKKTNFQKRSRKFVKNIPATVAKMLDELLLSSIVIKSCIQGHKNRKTKLGFFFRCVTFRSVVQIERLFINFAIQTGEVVA